MLVGTVIYQRSHTDRLKKQVKSYRTARDQVSHEDGDPSDPDNHS